MYIKIRLHKVYEPVVTDQIGSILWGHLLKDWYLDFISINILQKSHQLHNWEEYKVKYQEIQKDD